MIHMSGTKSLTYPHTKNDFFSNVINYWPICLSWLRMNLGNWLNKFMDIQSKRYNERLVSGFSRKGLVSVQKQSISSGFKDQWRPEAPKPEFCALFQLHQLRCCTSPDSINDVQVEITWQTLTARRFGEMLKSFKNICCMNSTEFESAENAVKRWTTLKMLNWQKNDKKIYKKMHMTKKSTN